jgi:hypothetical protein
MSLFQPLLTDLDKYRWDVVAGSMACLTFLLLKKVREVREVILLESCLQTSITYTIAECTVNNSWWWTEELSETCRVSFQNKIGEISASNWFYYKEIYGYARSHERKKLIPMFAISYPPQLTTNILTMYCIYEA